MVFPKYLKIGIPVGVVIFVIILSIAITENINRPDYRLEIDAIKVKDLVHISNVRLTNTGKLPLTGLEVNFGESDIQSFKKLDPGETIWVSPKAQNLISVTVTSKEGLVVVKEFREPVGMVPFVG